MEGPTVGLTVTVGGVDLSSVVEQGTLRIEQVLTRRGDTATFTLPDVTLARGIAPLAPVTVSDELGNVKFGGLVTRIKRSADRGAAVNYFQCACQDYTYLLQKTLGNKKYQNQTVDQIARDLLASFPCGVTTTNVQSGLPSLAFFNVAHLRLSDALDKLVRMASASAVLLWDVDGSKDLHLFDQQHVPSADVVLDDGAPTYNKPSGQGAVPRTLSLASPSNPGRANYRRGTFSYEVDASQLANQVTVRGGTYLSGSYSQSWVGNGLTSSFGLDYPPDATPEAGGALPTVTVAGVAQTVALDTGNGFGSHQALVSVSQLSQVAALLFAAPPASGATVQATYLYDLPVLARVKNQASIGAYGTFEEYVVDSKLQTQAAARQRGNGELAQFAVPLIRCQADVDQTYVGSLGAGQLVTVKNGQLGVDTALIVTKCGIRGIAGGYYRHSLDLMGFYS